MDLPPWMILPFMYVTKGSVHITTGTGQVVGADPSRIYLAIIFEGNLTGNIKPDGWPAGLVGYKIPTNQNYLDFNFRDHPGLVNDGWTATISAPGDVSFISIDYKPDN